VQGSTETQTTQGDPHRVTLWEWAYCEKCPHHVPLACAVPVIRWGAEISSDKLRQCARCTAYGYKGAMIQNPGWGRADFTSHTSVSLIRPVVAAGIQNEISRKSSVRFLTEWAPELSEAILESPF
jgi:hypothetical protein